VSKPTPERRPRPAAGVVPVLLLVTLLWGGSYPAIKATQATFPPLAFAAFRCAVATAVLLALGLLLGLRRPGPRLRDWARVAALGIAGNTLFQLGLVAGVHHTSPSHAALMVALSPVFATLLAWLCLGDRPSAARGAGILLAFAGAALILAPAGAGGGSGRATWLGDLLSLGAGLAWALYTVFGKPLLAREPPRDVTTWAMLFGTLPLLPLGLPGVGAVPWGSVSLGSWLLLAYLTVGTLVIANFLWYWALARAATARVVVITYLNPVIAALISIALGQETLSGRLAAGAVAVIGGVALAQRR
jgi:drug/metabolite transporter (DMT)-like permease